MRIFQGFIELVLPSRCVGCGCLHRELCRSCSQELQLHDFRSQSGSTPVFSSIKYGSKAGRILLAAKEDGVRKAEDLLLAALSRSFNSAVHEFGIRPLLVPIPHRRQALRRRGRDFVGDLTCRLALQEALSVRDIIRHSRRVRDQSLLDSSSRFENLSGAMGVVRHCGRPCEVFVVDDLITTGATLAEAVRTLEKSGFSVVAAVTALVALPLR